MRVIIRYTDGQPFIGEWEDAPAYGAQTVAYIDNKTGESVLRHQGDYYLLNEDGSITPIDFQTLVNWCAEQGYIKVGTFIGQNEWQRIYELGKKDAHSLG